MYFIVMKLYKQLAAALSPYIPPSTHTIVGHPAGHPASPPRAYGRTLTCYTFQITINLAMLAGTSAIWAHLFIVTHSKAKHMLP